MGLTGLVSLIHILVVVAGKGVV